MICQDMRQKKLSAETGSSNGMDTGRPSHIQNVRNKPCQKKYATQLHFCPDLGKMGFVETRKTVPEWTRD